MENPEKIEIAGLKTIRKLCKFGADNNMEGCTFTEIVERMFDELAKAQAVPEGFVLVPKAGAQYFSHDFNGDGFKYHDTLDEAKKEAEGNLDWYRDQVADGRHVNDMGEFNELSYGLVIGSAEYSIDHVVTQDDIDKGEYSYEVGTEILSLYLSEAQEQSHD